MDAMRTVMCYNLSTRTAAFVIDCSSVFQGRSLRQPFVRTVWSTLQSAVTAVKGHIVEQSGMEWSGEWRDDRNPKAWSVR